MKDTALAQLAQYFNTTPAMIMLAICAIAIVVITAVGVACIELSTAPKPEGDPDTWPIPPGRDPNRRRAA